jgi:hypothetical protein
MKIKPDDYKIMRDAISKLLDERGGEVAVHAANIRNGMDNRVKDPEKRIRWDLSYAAGLTRFICDDIYPYANDGHVDTALRAIVKELQV